MQNGMERRAEQMRDILRDARERNRRIVADALSGRVVAKGKGRRSRKRETPPPSPFSTDEANAILRQALDRAAAVELRWQMMFPATERTA